MKLKCHKEVWIGVEVLKLKLKWIINIQMKKAQTKIENIEYKFI